ncbi:MAG: hypothetical protein KDD44_10220 [Bdellovibrionales bacterium]|nr:hypothetical protein [Bdellovibrionales bacterium]
MTSQIPPHLSLYATRKEIHERVQKAAVKINAWAGEVLAQTNEQVLGLCILRGGVFFFSDLLRQMSVSVEPAFCRTWSYSSRTNQQVNKSVRVNVEDVVAEGRAILLVDDICDSGSTLRKLSNVLLDLGATDVRSVVLVHREVAVPNYQPTWTIFQHAGPQWFVGYGMEDRNRYANLPDLYTMAGQTEGSP